MVALSICVIQVYPWLYVLFLSSGGADPLTAAVRRARGNCRPVPGIYIYIYSLCMYMYIDR